MFPTRTHGPEEFGEARRSAERRPDDEVVGHLSAACGRMPRAVICLLSAAHLHGLLAETPSRSWLALPQGSNLARGFDGWQVIRWTNLDAFREGVTADGAFGFPVRRTDPVRTVVDLVRYSRLFRGMRPGIDAARSYVAAGGEPEDMLAMADALRISGSVRHNLEIIASALCMARR